MKHAICPSCGELSAKELLKIMPTDGSIAEIYKRLSPQKKVESSIPTWGKQSYGAGTDSFYPLSRLWTEKGLLQLNIRIASKCSEITTKRWFGAMRKDVCEEA